MTEDHRPEAHVNNKATYTKVCNLLVPWQQEMQLSRGTTSTIHVFYKQHVRKILIYMKTCRFDMLSNRSICYQIRSDMGFINLLFDWSDLYKERGEWAQPFNRDVSIHQTLHPQPTNTLSVVLIGRIPLHSDKYHQGFTLFRLLHYLLRIDST